MAETTPQTIQVEVADRVGRIWLNRPEVRNAFNALMIGELREALRALARDEAVRVVVLSGRGTSFCAGADLNWMREIVRFSYAQNLAESLELAALHWEFYSLPKPTIARVNGPAIGGGVSGGANCGPAASANPSRHRVSSGFSNDQFT